MTGKGLYTLVVDGVIPSDEIEGTRKHVSSIDSIKNVCSWKEHDDHMKKLSKMFPNDLMGLVCLPEFSNTPWVKIYKDGELICESKGKISVNIEWLHNPDGIDDNEYLMLQNTVSNYQLVNRLVASYTNSKDIPPMETSALLKDNLNPHDTNVSHGLDDEGESVTILSPIDGEQITFNNLDEKQAEALKVLNQKYIVLKNEAQS